MRGLGATGSNDYICPIVESGTVESVRLSVEMALLTLAVHNSTYTCTFDEDISLEQFLAHVYNRMTQEKFVNMKT